jgi:hypothetical protein
MQRLASVIKSVLVVMFIMLSFIRASGMVVVDNVACKAVERGERCDPREISDHIGVGLHRLYRCKVAPLRVDDYMTLIRGGDEAGRDPAIEPADDGFSIVTQEFDELLLILRLNSQDVDKGRDFFHHRNCRVHGFSSNALLSVRTS